MEPDVADGAAFDFALVVCVVQCCAFEYVRYNEIQRDWLASEYSVLQGLTLTLTLTLTRICNPKLLTLNP